jgi:hypothetical protein
MRSTLFASLVNPAGAFIIAILAAFAGTSPAPADPIVFGAHTEYTVSSNPLDLAFGDFNGDGLWDIATTKTDSFSEPAGISILINSGGGTFEPSVAVPTIHVPRCLDAGDLDGDGDTDIMVGFQSGDHRVAILRNDGQGDFESPDLIAPIPGRADAAATIDLDGDGDLDILLVQAAPGDEIVVLENEGSGSFAPAETYGGVSNAYFAHLAIGDVDADGDPDLAIGRSLDVDTQSLYRNNGDGTFAPQEDIPVPFGYTGNDLGDLDGDGDLDLALVNESGPSVLVLLNDGAGAFTTLGNFPSGADTQLGTELTLADLDDDGLADALIAGANTERVATLRSSGTGFEPAAFHPLGAIARRAEAGDLDGDGDLDLVASLFNTDEISVLLNELVSATAAISGPLPTRALSFGPATPNPMRAGTSIPLVLPQPAQVRIDIVDVRGRHVHSLFDGRHEEGRHLVTWDGRNRHGVRVPAGVYFVALRTEGERSVERIVLSE